MAETKNSKKVFDVSHPGKTPPPHSARPVITGHKMMGADPMVKTAPPVAEKSAPRSESIPSKAKVIEPVTLTADKPQEKPDKPAADSPATSDAEDSANAPGVIPTVNQGQTDAPTPDAQKKAQTQAEEAQAEAIHKLVTDKKYFLKIKEDAGGPSLGRLIAGIAVLILVGVGGYAAIDAGLFGDITVPIDLIKNTKTTPAPTPVITPPAPTTPVVATTTHTLSQYGISFAYPASWKLGSDTNTTNKAGLEPTDPLGDQTERFALRFDSSTVPPNGGAAAITKVTYTEVTVKPGKKIYLRELVLRVNGAVPQYQLIMSLTSNKLPEKTGDDTTTTFIPGFTAPDNATPMLGMATIVAGNHEKHWFTTSEKAEAYTRSTRYKSAKSILLSTKFTK